MRAHSFIAGLLLLISIPCAAAEIDARTAFAQAGAKVTRTPIADGVVEYSAILRVGPGAFDEIGIHRVVRERAPWFPAHESRGIVLVHGSASSFRTAFAPGLTTSAFPIDAGLAPFLAKADIDVWGIDLRWTFVPIDTTDTSFMKDWSLGLDGSDTQKVGRIARLVRGLTGSGFGKLFFSGHSLGGDAIYVLANAQTQLPEILRDVRGLIPLDIIIKLVSPGSQFLRDEAALRYRTYKGLYDSGTYAFTLGAQLIPVIGLGLSDPDGASALLPGFTNIQVATAVFSLTGMFYAPLPPYTPFYHFLAGTFDAAGAPTGFQLEDRDTVLTWALGFPPLQSMLEGVEVDALISDAVDSPYDDHLGDITVPVFHVAAAGGFGVYGLETLDLLGSTDKSSLVVRLLPPGNEAVDFGHVDILAASNAPTLVWTPILDWLRTH